MLENNSGAENKETGHDVLRRKKIALVINERKVKVITDEITHNIYLLTYRSKQGNSNIELNGKARDIKNNMIVCRQLSYLAALKNLKNLHTITKEKATIEQQPLLKLNVWDNCRLAYVAEKYFFFPLEKIGVQLQQLAEVLENNKPQSYLFSSGTHLMVIVLQAKKNGIFKIKFYDPNPSNIYYNLLCSSREEIKYIKIEHLLSQIYIKHYFENFQFSIFNNLFSFSTCCFG